MDFGACKDRVDPDQTFSTAVHIKARPHTVTVRDTFVIPCILTICRYQRRPAVSRIDSARRIVLSYRFSHGHLSYFLAKYSIKTRKIEQRQGIIFSSLWLEISVTRNTLDSRIPIEFGQTGISAIRSADPENPVLEPNTE